MLIKDLLSRWRIKVDDHQLDHTAEKLEQIKNRIEVIGAAELLKGIYEMAEHFGEFAEQLLTTAESAGVGVDALQRLQYAATQSGVSADDVTSSMARLSRSLYEAQSGSKEALKLFADIGISQQQVAGIHNGEQAFRLLSDRVATIQDPIKRQAVLMSLLGRGSYRMAAMMAKGSAALDDMGKQADDAGAVISESTLHALDDMQNTLETLGMVIKNITATIASYFSPVVKMIAQDFIHLWGSNQAVLKANWHGWARTLAYILGFIDGLVVGLVRRFQLFAEEHPILTKLAEGLAISLTSLGIAGAALGTAMDIAGWFATKLAGGLGLIQDLGAGPFKLLLWAGKQFRSLIAKLFLNIAVLVSESFPALAASAIEWGAALEATPVGWFATALAAIVLLLEAAYTMFFKGGKFEDTWLGKMWKGIKGLGSGIADFLGIGKKGEEATQQSSGGPARSLDDASEALMKAPEGLNNIAALRKDSMESQALMARASAGGPGRMSAEDMAGTTNINSNMTFNIDGGKQDPKAIAKAVGDHVQDRFGTVARNIKRAHATLEHP